MIDQNHKTLFILNFSLLILLFILALNLKEFKETNSQLELDLENMKWQRDQCRLLYGMGK